jgi:hypothetical protein
MEEIRAMHTNRIGAVVAIMFSGMLVPVAVAQENCMHPRIISVTGTAEIKVPPDEMAAAHMDENATYQDLATSWRVIGVVRSQLFRGHRRADKVSHATAGFG